MAPDTDLRRDQLAALMVAERDAEMRSAGAVEVVSWPETVERRRSAVEFIGRDEHGTIAVEHTVIESYPSQIAERTALGTMFPLGGPNLVDVSHAGHFRLIAHVDELLRIPRQARAQVETTVERWTRAALPTAPWPHVPGQPTFVRGQLDELRLELSLERWTDGITLVGPLARVVQVGFWRPLDLEDRRTTRLKTALRKKVPKLLAAAQGARTILVLEDRDMRMSAPAFVSRALAAAAGTAVLPDVIYLMNVTSGNPLLTPIYSSQIWWHEGEHGWLTFSDARSAAFNRLDP